MTLKETIEATLELSDIIINIRASDLIDAEKENLINNYLYQCPHGYNDSDDCPDCRH